MKEFNNEWIYLDDLEDLGKSLEYRIDKFIEEILSKSKEKKIEEINLREFIDLYEDYSSEVIKIVFFVIDCRGGLGYRKLAYKLLEPINNSLKFRLELEKYLHKLPEYGRYDNLLYFMDTPLENLALKIYAEKLIEDKKILDKKIVSKIEQEENTNLTISQAAKWAPSENKKHDKENNSAYKLAWTINMLNGYSEKCDNIRRCLRLYRKEYISYLRQNLNIPERIMCNKNYQYLCDNKYNFYNNLPYGHMKRHMLRKDSFWMKTDPQGSYEFLKNNIFNYLKQHNYKKININKLEINDFKSYLENEKYKI